MNTSRWVLVAVAVAGLLAVRLAHGAEETGIILKQPLEPELGQAEECLSTRHVRNFDILNDKLVILKGTHDRFWINRLPVACLGLKSDMVLKVELFGSRICNNDWFRDRKNNRHYV